MCISHMSLVGPMQADPDVPPFLYGSHYSSAGAVLFYLIRLEPFSGLARTLQVRGAPQKARQ